MLCRHSPVSPFLRRQQATEDLILFSRRPSCISHLTVLVAPRLARHLTRAMSQVASVLKIKRKVQVRTSGTDCGFGYEIAACSWLRDVMPSFGKIRYRWALTVRCEM